MWLATRHGFYSIVEKEGGLQIRARLRSDLANLLRLARLRKKIIETPLADYRFRAIVTRAELAAIFSVLSANIDYRNFKDEIARRPDQSARLGLYHQVWATLARLQES
jgi:hypothetical protein